MTVHNTDIARLFNEMADLLEIEEANPFRVRAYRRAAATIEDLPESAANLVAGGADLSRLPGIGKDLAAKIAEIVETGHLTVLDEVETRTPATLAQITALPGLGPKRAHLLYETLGIATLEDLAKAAAEGKIRMLKGFSAGLEAKLLAAIANIQAATQRFRISIAEELTQGLEAHLTSAHGVGKVTTAGSFRRRRETVGDLDILVTAADGKAVMDHLVRYDEVADVLSKGRTRSTVRLKSGIQVDVRVVPEQSYGAAMHYFTGSKAHNIVIRKMAQAKGLKLNEYGIFRGKKRIGGRTEREVFAAVGLPYIEPELREDRGEIEAARRKRLPKLIELADIRGDLHTHTKASDGKNSLAEMARAAKASGYEYFAVSDHSKHATVAHGLDAKRLSAQLDEIDKLDERLKGIRILKSCEVDILEDGTLDLPDTILKRLDFTVCAVHYGFNLSAKAQAERIMRAMDNPHFTILAHPTGRLLGERPAYPLDLDRVMAAAKERGCFFEVNAHPMRLDLDDVHCRAAKEMGLKVAISTDAHSTIGLGLMRFGIGQARRGWLEAPDVLNTRPWSRLKTLLAR